MKKNLYIIVGYPKTGTSNIQFYFKNEKKYKFFGKHFSKKNFTNELVTKIIDIIINSNNETFEKKKSELKYLAKKIKFNKNNMIIDDLLSFSLLLPPHYIWRRVVKIFGNLINCKLVLITRDTNSLILSLLHENYFYYLIFNYKIKCKVSYEKIFKILKHNFNYNLQIKLFKKAYPNFKVKVFSYEKIFLKKKINDFCKFFSIQKREFIKILKINKRPRIRKIYTYKYILSKIKFFLLNILKLKNNIRMLINLYLLITINAKRKEFVSYALKHHKIF